jgi:phosphatidylglycerophosphate synthase
MDKVAKKNRLLMSVPNILTSLRFTIPIILFLTPFKIETKLILAFFLYAITDFFDGIIARALGNTSGFGKILDPLADKVTYASLAIFLFAYSLVEIWITKSVIVGELFIFSLGAICVAMYLVREVLEYKNHSMKSLWRKTTKEMADNLNVNWFGKSKMVWYSGGILLASLNHIFSHEFFHSGYQVAFLLGLVFCAVSGIFYVIDFVKWVDKFISGK